MKNMKYLMLTVFFFLTAVAFAQTNLEDVMYLKNGSIYRGTIIEQVPGESYKIQIAGGSIISLTVAEVQKITKETAYNTRPQYHDREKDNFTMMPHFMMAKRDTPTKPAYLRKRRFFSTIEFRPGNSSVGLRIVHGYKFGRFGYLGIGFGVDAVSFSNRMFDSKHLFDNTRVNNGLYLPLYIHYSGDILRKRITPYYFIEAGYAAHPVNPFVSSNGIKTYGGPTAAAGFGVKFNSKGRTSFALNLNATYRTDRYRVTRTTTDILGNPYTYNESGMKGKAFGSLGLTIGF